MKKRYLIAAAAPGLAMLATPVAAQDQPGDRVNQLVIFGDDPCPQSSEDEIVVCARKDESERYRIPETLNWARYDFNVNSFVFIRTTSDSLPRYSRYRNPTTGLPMHVYFRDRLGAEVDLNWGRYLLLNSKSIMVTAYDERRFRLCVPVKVPLPTVVARTVCLCSGKPPVHRTKECLVQGLNCQDWLMFEDVPPQIAVAALSKVGQSPVRVEIR